MTTKLLFIAFASLGLCSAYPILHAQNDEAADYRIIENKAKLPLLNPSLAKRQFTKLILNNGLQVYLISDPDAEQSAAGLSVEAGSWQDPPEYPGMAHFLEHMLFMGTKAYPDESEYMEYIRDNGGSVNASTWPDRTAYMFSINNEAYQGALDRFSHFFIDPLFSTSSINRELHAVDQEHAKNIENDNWREYMIFKETGNPNHPNAAFSTGNAQTLSGIPQQALVDWYKSHYSADQMHLILISPLPTNELILLVNRDFSQIPNYGLKKEHSLPPLASENQIGHMIYIKPIKDLRRLSLVWEIPSKFARNMEKKAPELVAAILNNDSDTSLSQELKREKIAESIDVSIDRYNRDQVLFRIDINLTKEGLSKIDTAAMRCFQAIAELKKSGVPAYFYDEVRQMAIINYQYQSRVDAFDFVMRNAHDLIDEDLATYPEKLMIPTTYDPAYISQFVQTLTPGSCMFFLQADPVSTGVEPTNKEKWMDAEYAIQPVSSSQIETFSTCSPNAKISLPEKNRFIPTQLTLKPHSENQTSVISPKLLVNDDGCKLYYEQDLHYLVPEAALLFGLKTPLVNGTARSTALVDLYLKSLTEKLSSTLYFAQFAGLSPSFYQQDLKIQFGVQGYSEKAPILLKEIFKTIQQVAPSKSDFEIYKEWLLTNYDNANKELPVRQGLELLNSLLYNDSPSNIEKWRALKTVTYEEFLTFCGQLFKSSYVEGLLYGNLLEKDAQALWSELKKNFGSLPYPVDMQTNRTVLVLPPNQGPYMMVQKTERQGNGVVLLLEQGKFTFEKRAAQQVLSKALQEAFFDTLRTKQQTSYFARAWDSEVERELFQFFAVQSSTHQPRDLIARFELFLEDFVKTIPEKISEERFENLQKMLVTTLQMPPENLEGMSQRLYLLAFNYEADFNWYQKRIESVQALTYPELFQAAQEFLSRDNPRRIAVLVEGVLSADNDFKYREMSKKEICDLGTYVSWR